MIIILNHFLRFPKASGNCCQFCHGHFCFYKQVSQGLKGDPGGALLAEPWSSRLAWEASGTPSLTASPYRLTAASQWPSASSTHPRSSGIAFCGGQPLRKPHPRPPPTPAVGPAALLASPPPQPVPPLPPPSPLPLPPLGPRARWRHCQGRERVRLLGIW